MNNIKYNEDKLSSINVRDDVKLTRHFLQSEAANTFKELQNPAPLSSVFQAFCAWGAMLLSTYLTVLYSFYFLPIAILSFGWAQRVLNNIMHDASHKNCFKNSFVNDLFSNCFSSYPLFDNINDYRVKHNAHHAKLGGSEDPDLVCFKKFGGDERVSFGRIYIWRVLSKDVFISSLFGSLFSSSKKSVVGYIFWWISFSLLLSILVSVNYAVSFFLIWNLSRATVFHLIVSFTELTDHACLESESIFSFSRTLPNGAVASYLHPFGDVYHLAHHLIPNVPISKLKHIHKHLVNMEEYKCSSHFESYFVGDNSVVKSIVIKP